MRSVRFVHPGDDESLRSSRDESDRPDSQAAVAAPSTEVIVEAEDGERFELTVDDALREALHLEPVAGRNADDDEDHDSADEESPAVSIVRSAPSGPPLSPRDIQVRVRSGEAPEDLAADSSTPLDKIMRFAFPVLEERARIGDEARRARARRDGDGALVPFGDTVDRRFLAHGIDPSSVLWDSFRRPDGSWVVIASWKTGEHERHAHWAFSLAARTVLPADEVGSDLLSDRPLRPVVRAVPDATELAAQAEAVYDQESPGAYSGPRHDMVSPAHPTVAAAPRSPATDDRDSAQPMLPMDPPLPLRLAEPLHPRPTIVPELVEPDQSVTGSIGFDELFDANIVEEAPATEEPAPASKRAARGKSAREQTKIPSWDDILLGVRRKQD